MAFNRQRFRETLFQWRHPLSVVLLLSVALCFRVPATRQALPYTHSWDEPFIINPAIRIIKTGDWNPFFQIYPNGYVYMQTFAATSAILSMAGRGELQYLSDVQSGDEAKYLWHVSHPEIYRRGRLLAALIGAMLALTVYAVGTVHFSWLCGFLAGLFVCLSRQAIISGATIVSDNPAALFFTGGLFFLLKLVPTEDARPRDYIWGGILTGIAAGMKYNAGVILPAFFAVHLWRNGARNFFSWDIAFFFLCAVVSFLICSPYSLLDYDEFVKAMMYNVYHYQFGAFHGNNAGFWGNLKGYYLLEFNRFGLSSPTMWLAAVGTVAGFFISRRKHLVLLLVIVCYTCYFSSMKVHFFRNMLPVIPLVCILAAMPAVLAWRFRNHTSRSVGIAVTAAAIVLGIWPAGSLAMHAVPRVRALAETVDPRHGMMKYISDKIPENRLVALDENLHFYQEPKLKKRLKGTNVFAMTFSELRQAGVDYVVVADTYKFSAETPENKIVEAYLNSRFAPLPSRQQFGAAPLLFASLPTNPKMVLRSLDQIPDNPRQPNLLVGLAMKAYGKGIADFDTGALQLWSSGTIFGDVEITSPTTTMIANISGRSGKTGYPHVRITARSLSGGSEVLVSQDLVVPGWASYPQMEIPCVLPPGKWQIHFLFTNGPTSFDPMAREEPVFGVKLVRFR